MADVTRSRRRGPSPKPPHALRRRTITVHVTDAELALLARSAERVGAKSLGGHLLERAIGRQVAVIPAVNRAMWGHLGKWAGAFTTIANAAAGERLTSLYPHLSPSLEIALDRVRAELRALRFALLGLDLFSVDDPDRPLGDADEDDGSPGEAAA